MLWDSSNFRFFALLFVFKSSPSSASKSNLTIYSRVDAPNLTVYPSRSGSRFRFLRRSAFTKVPCDEPKSITYRLPDDPWPSKAWRREMDGWSSLMSLIWALRPNKTNDLRPMSVIVSILSPPLNTLNPQFSNLGGFTHGGGANESVDLDAIVRI